MCVFEERGKVGEEQKERKRVGGGCCGGRSMETVHCLPLYGSCEKGIKA